MQHTDGFVDFLFAPLSEEILVRGLVMSVGEGQKGIMLGHVR